MPSIVELTNEVLKFQKKLPSKLIGNSPQGKHTVAQLEAIIKQSLEVCQDMMFKIHANNKLTVLSYLKNVPSDVIPSLRHHCNFLANIDLKFRIATPGLFVEKTGKTLESQGVFKVSKKTASNEPKMGSDIKMGKKNKP